MSRTNGHKPGSAGTSGFTFVELMVALTISTFVFAGVTSAYLFLGRNLARLTNSQQLEQSSRRAFYQFDKDVKAASAITALSDTSLTLTTTTTNETITYTYSSGTGTLMRVQDISSDALAAVSTTLLTNVTAFDFNFYNKAGTSITSTLAVKAIDFSFTLGTGLSSTSNVGVATRGDSTHTTAAGLASSGTAVSYRGVSPRAIIRNSSLLQ